MEEEQGGFFNFGLTCPSFSLSHVFNEIKIRRKDNLEGILGDDKGDKECEEEVKGLKFIARKIKVLLIKNKMIEYDEASRILIANFAKEAKGERNIRRRVYDAINVLLAAGVLKKKENKIELICQDVRSYSEKSFEKELKDKTKVNEMKRKKVENLKDKLNVLEKLFEEKEILKHEEYLVFACAGKIKNVEIEKVREKKTVSMMGGKIIEKPENLANFTLHETERIFKKVIL